MSGHTPGRWENAAVEHGKAHIVKGPPMTVSYLGCAFLRREDARLVAAAPEMLAALKSLMEDYHGSYAAFESASKMAEAIIAKAEGKS